MPVVALHGFQTTRLLSGSALATLRPFAADELGSLRSRSLHESREAYVYLRVLDPLVAWLAYRGEMVSASRGGAPAISFWTIGTLRTAHAAPERFRDELNIEKTRAEQFPEAVSRLSGFYAFPDRASAARAASWGPGFPASDLAEIAILEGSRVSKHDADWITANLGRRTGSDWMRAYLKGDAMSDSPTWELLVDGRALVLGTRLRETAYETVRRNWPASLPLLELARVGVELNSDLGSIAGLAISDGGGQRVEFFMDFRDATSESFLRRFADFPGPKNLQDLRPDSDLVMPDLRGRTVWIVRP